MGEKRSPETARPRGNKERCVLEGTQSILLTDCLNAILKNKLTLVKRSQGLRNSEVYVSIKKSIHHSFDIDLASKYGIEEAIIIHHFQHWISINARLNRNLHEDTYWSYQTCEEIAAHFPYLSKDQVFNIIEKLCTGKSRHSKKDSLPEFEPILKKGNFNKSKFDRTVWYAFCDPAKWILCDRKMENVDPQNQERGPATPIPNTKPDTDSKESKHIEDALVFGKFVKLTKEEYEKSCQEITKEITDSLIDQINDFLASTGKKPYKDYAATIRVWFRRSKNQPKQSQTARTTDPNIEKNLEAFRGVLEALAKRGRKPDIYLRGTYVYHQTGDSVSLALPHQSFLDIICNWTGLKAK